MYTNIMIIDFTVSNFRSIRDEQTLSLHVENPGKHFPEHVAYPAGDRIGVLKSWGIYGANASGKTNLLIALDVLQNVIDGSGDLKDGDPIPWYQPFRLSEATKNTPTHFEIEFITPKQDRFSYYISFDGNRVWEEQLIGYVTSKPSVLFKREPTDTWDTVKFGVNLKGGKRKFPFFANNAYLSKAGNSADAPDMIRDAYNYLRHNILLTIAPRRGLGFVRIGWASDENFLKQISALLALADTGIASVSTQERKFDEESLQMPTSMPDEVRKAILNDFKMQPVFLHNTESGTAEAFKFEAESEGTKQLFSLAPMLISALKEQRVWIVDELESSMHPFMAELIVKLFNDPEVNPKGAQLLFTTHNVEIMSPDKLRRDQIWFAEKSNGESRYFSLQDFDKNIVKPQSPYSRWYLEGRFDAIPKINYRKIAEMLKTARETENDAEAES